MIRLLRDKWIHPGCELALGFQAPSSRFNQAKDGFGPFSLCYVHYISFMPKRFRVLSYLRHGPHCFISIIGKMQEIDQLNGL